MKYILVTGGVISGLGKGVISSSLGALLKGFNLNVTAIKIDPYINIDAGTFSPYEHGEVFVLDDGGEVDLDLGNYERFLNIRLGRDNNITTGKIFERVISKERQGAYLGRTVQYIPHITDEIQLWVENIAQQPVRNDNNGVGGTPQICIIELGGTIGDIESAPFVEAFRFLQRRVGVENFLNVHLSPVLEPKSVGEQKTKPTQRSVQELRKLGLHPDLIMCRCENPISDKIREKISLFCDVSSDQVISVHDVESIYQIPTLLFEQNVVKILNNILRLNLPMPITLSHLSESSSIKKWVQLAEAESKCREEVKITLVGKYTKLEDSYASVIKALHHAGVQLERKIRISYVEGCDLVEKDRAENFSEERYTKAWNELKAMDGLLVPGGFDMRGVEGMINAIKFARTEKKPFLGICLGFQCATIEFARNVVGLTGANSTEFNPKAEHKVVVDMPEHTTGDMGGTMRLGLRTTHFTPEYSLLRKLYNGANSIEERHRHRYEVNPEYVSQLEKKGLKFTGKDSEKVRMEVLEYHDHPYFVAIQYHPEFLSRPLKPSPPFLGLVAASSNQLEKLLKS